MPTMQPMPEHRTHRTHSPAERLPSFIGDVRRFGAFGPAYEVTDTKPWGDLVITVIESGECLDYALAEFLADPVAETVP